MTQPKREIGQVYAYNYGYSICAYEFYKIVRLSKSSMWLQELGKKWVSGDGQQGEVVCTYHPIPDKPLKMCRLDKYIGSLYNGEELYEDHCD